MEEFSLHACQREHRRSEEHTSELQSRENLVCRLLLEKKKKISLAPLARRHLSRTRALYCAHGYQTAKLPDTRRPVTTLMASPPSTAMTFFFFNDTATTDIYTLSLHDALPIFLEVRKAPTPTNDVTFTVGRNAFALDLGAAQVLIPEDQFGLGGTSRLLDVGFGIK